MTRLCVFCGSNIGGRDAYARAARALGEALARRGTGLVYGGGNVGLMGVVADAVLAAGGEAIGVIPEALLAKEVGHRHLTRLHVVGSMHERKAMMAELSDGFIAMPGGYGTLEEFCEVLTWAQLGFHRKPCALLNVDGFYDPLLKLFQHAVAERFVRPEYRRMVLCGDDPERLLDAMAAYRAPPVEQWICDRETT